MTDIDPQETLHRAIQNILDEGEISVNWILTIDVAGPNDIRYLAHRSGGGVDGNDSPMIWHALGMINAAKVVAEKQVSDVTYSDDTDSDDFDEEEKPS